ncbi:hypothetical protein AB0N24_04270 [Arthrobacter sp. NPDC093128]|uniref:hypothetical protein n=1 Tax=Arthrobacter sp. NPDC093128 TaxID=3154979 RepID=UPI00341CFEBF
MTRSSSLAPTAACNAAGVGQNVGDWQSCDACAALLERGDWDGLTRRACAAAQERGQTDGLDWDVFVDKYRQLRGHVIGRVGLH